MVRMWSWRSLLILSIMAASVVDLPEPVEHVGTEAGQSLQSKRKVELQALLEAVLLGIGHDAVGQLLGFSGRHLRQIQRHEMPVNADLGRRIGSDVEIAAVHLQHSLQQVT